MEEQTIPHPPIRPQDRPKLCLWCDRMATHTEESGRLVDNVCDDCCECT
jgi:hypothetical protein